MKRRTADGGNSEDGDSGGSRAPAAAAMAAAAPARAGSGRSTWSLPARVGPATLMDVLDYVAARGYGAELAAVTGLCRATWAADDAALTAEQNRAARAESPLWRALAVAQRGEDARTRLMYAAYVGDERRLAHLLAAGACVCAASASGWSALHWAAAGGRADAALELLVVGADANARSTQGVGQSLLYEDDSERAYFPVATTPLTIAARSCSDAAFVRLLLERGADAALVDAYGQSALHTAARGGSVDVLHALTAAGLDIDRPDGQGETPLARAAAGRLRCTAFALELLARGADARLFDNGGGSALVSAINQQNAVLFHALLGAGVLIADEDADARLLGPAALSLDGDAAAPLDILGELLHLGARGVSELYDDPDEGTNRPVLSIACERSRAGAALLLGRGADITKRARDGATALHAACRHGALDTVQLLLDRGAPTAARDDAGRTPLHMLLEGGGPLSEADRLIIATALLRDDDGDHLVLDAVAAEGGTALHLAYARQHFAIARLLLESGAAPALRCNFGWMPLHDLAMMDCEGWPDAEILCVGEHVRLLVEKGAQLEARTDNRRSLSPLMCAADAGGLAALTALLALHASVSPRDADGDTALAIAACAGHVACLEPLVRAGASADERRPVVGAATERPLVVRCVVLGQHAAAMELLRLGAEPKGVLARLLSPAGAAGKGSEEQRFATARAALERELVLRPASAHPLHLIATCAPKALPFAARLLQLVPKSALFQTVDEDGLTPLEAAMGCTPAHARLLFLAMGRPACALALARALEGADAAAALLTIVAPLAGGKLAGWLLKLNVPSAKLHRTYSALIQRAAHGDGGGDGDDAAHAVAAVLLTIARQDGWSEVRTLLPAAAATDPLCQGVAQAMAALAQRAAAAAAPVGLSALLAELRSAGSPRPRGVDVVRAVVACVREGWLDVREGGAFSLRPSR